jgi:alpha-glucosidase
MLLNLGLSGIAFTGADIGGFEGTPTPELFARWISMGAFTPFFRTHTAKNTPRQEPWSFGAETEAIARIYLEWRYRLLPYLYTTFWQCSESGAPIMRPLWYEDPAAATLSDIDDQWLLGDHLLVAPVLTPHSHEREIVLPAGRWYDFWTDESHQGPDTIIRAAPLDMVPLYVRGGGVIPLAPVRQTTAQMPTEPITLHLYPGEGESWFYEDDGISLDYQQGIFRLTHFRLEQTGPGRWLLDRTVQGDFQPEQECTQLTIHGGPVAQVWVDGVSVPTHRTTLDLPSHPWRRVEIQMVSKI